MSMRHENPPDEAWEAVQLDTAKRHLRHCFARDIVPHIEDSRRVRETALATLARHAAPLDAPGERLYLLSYEGVQSYVKVGRTDNSEGRGLEERLTDHEHDAELGMVVLFDGWVSKAWPSTRTWETRVVDALKRLPGVVQIHREYFSGVDYGTALEIVHRERTV